MADDFDDTEIRGVRTLSLHFIHCYRSNSLIYQQEHKGH